VAGGTSPIVFVCWCQIQRSAPTLQEYWACRLPGEWRVALQLEQSVSALLHLRLAQVAKGHLLDVNVKLGHCIVDHAFIKITSMSRCVSWLSLQAG
jgi:hypothetical protein